MKGFKWVASLLAICLLSISTFAEARPKASEFPDKCIIIGTHVIFLDALNSEVLAVASTSAQASGQEGIYFKSDINKGVWYDISDSDDISQISITTDNVVSNQVIDALPLTHYTKSNGQTVDFLTGQVVNAAFIDDLTNPRNMPELDELETELDIQKGLYDNQRTETDKDKDKKEIYKQKVDSMTKVLSLIEGQAITDANTQLTKMEAFIGDLRGKGEPAEKIEVAVQEKNKIAQEKDAFCYQTVLNRINEENQKLDYTDCSDLIAKYATAATAIQGILTQTGTTSDAQEKSPIEKLTDKYSEQLKGNVDSGNNGGAEDALSRLYALQCIQNQDSNVSAEDLTVQKAVLDELIRLTEAQVNDAIGDIVGSEYEEARKRGESTSFLNQLKDSALSDILAHLSNLQTLVEYKNSLTEDDAAKLAHLERVKGLYDKALDEANRGKVSESGLDRLQANKGEITDAINALKLGALPGYKDLKEATENQKKKVEALNESYLGAIEEGQMDAADKLKSRLDAAVEGMLALEDKLEEVEANVGKEQKNLPNDVQGLLKDIADMEAHAEDKEDDGTSEQGVSATTEKEAADQEAKYTDNEMQAMNQMVNKLNAQNPKATGMDAWYLLFKDYDIKLTTPVFKLGKDIFIPAEELAKQMGAQVIKSRTGAAMVIRDKGVLIEYIEGDKTVYVNDKKMAISLPPTRMISNRIYLPLSVFEKAYGLENREEGNYILVSKK